MIPDIINEIAEKTVKGMRDFVEKELAECGYDRDYVRRHIYDFITVNLRGVDLDGSSVSYVVHVPDERVLFGVRRKVSFEGEMHEHITIDYEWMHAATLLAYGEDAEAEVKRCARDARQRAEETLNMPPDAPERRTEGTQAD